MARVTVEDCLLQVSNRFALVHLAARRAKQLLKGSPSLVNAQNKEVVLSLREIAAAKVVFDENANISKMAEKELGAASNVAATATGTSEDVYTVDLSSDEID